MHPPATPPAAPSLAPGDPMWIGRYRLLGRLGQGGMGIVYLADGDGRLAALKVLREELAADDTVRARFAREVDAARRVAPGQPDGGGFSVKVGVSSAPGSSGWFEATFDNYSIWMQP